MQLHSPEQPEPKLLGFEGCQRDAAHESVAPAETVREPSVMIMEGVQYHAPYQGLWLGGDTSLTQCAE